MALYKVTEKKFNGQVVTHGEAMKYDAAYSMFVGFCDDRNADRDIDPEEVSQGDELSGEYEGGKCWIKLEEE